MKIGILGSGQLGWMMILEGRKLENEYYVLDRKNNGPASKISDGYYSLDQYREFVDKCDLVTYEFEHVDEKALQYAEDQGKLRPGLFSVELKRDRINEKEYLRKNGFPLADYRIAESFEEAREHTKEFERSVIKSATGGYDGKGQIFVRRGDEITDTGNGRYVVEEFVDFSAEASVIASRNENGDFRAHVPSFNLNQSGILIYNVAPFEDYGMTEMTRRIMDKLNYIGVMGVEYYIKDGKPIINEVAPRVHNTGHHTLHGSSISQFEQHIRAISGLPIPTPDLFTASGILNIIGTPIGREQLEKILKLDKTRYYWYGKDGVRRKRKVGHINITGISSDEIRQRIKDLMEIVYRGSLDSFL